MTTRHLVIILPDQLNRKISALKQFNKDEDTIFLSETTDYFSTAPHHQLKIAFQISCMRHFAKKLIDDGFPVIYSKIDSKKNSQSFITEILTAVKRTKPKKIII